MMIESTTVTERSMDPVALDKEYAIQIVTPGVLFMADPKTKLSYTRDFVQYLPEAEQPIWKCHVCREWFYRYGTDVIVSYVNGARQVRSAYFGIENAPAAFLEAAFEHLAEMLSDARPTTPRQVDNGGRSVGKGEVGGFPHLNAHFGQGVQVTSIPNTEYEHMKSSVLSYYRKLMTVKNTSKGELIDRLNQAVAVLGFDGKASAQIANHGKNIEVLIDYLRRSTTSGGPAWSFDNAPDSVRYVLYHLPGSSVGRFMEGFLFNDWTIEESVKEFVRNTDPEFYKRAEREASEREMADFGKLVEAYPGSIDWTMDTPDRVPLEVKFDTTRPGAVTEEEKPLTASERLKQAQANASKSAPKELDYVDAPSQKRMTLNEFIRTMAKDVVFMEFPSNRGSARFSFHYSLDLPEGARSPLSYGGHTAISTLVNPTYWTSVGINTDWTPVIGLCKAPWIGTDQEDRLQACYNWVLEGRALPGTLYPQVGAPLFADYYNGEFYKHRRSMETLIKSSSVILAGENPAVLVSAGSEVHMRVWTKAKVRMVVVITGVDQKMLPADIAEYNQAIAQ